MAFSRWFGNKTDAISPSLIPVQTLAVGLLYTSADCSNNGTATAQVAGGIAPYTYAWSNGQTTPVATGLAPNSIVSVVVKDANGNFGIQSIQVPDNCCADNTDVIITESCC